jgi:hypothetical protein
MNFQNKKVTYATARYLSILRWKKKKRSRYDRQAPKKQKKNFRIGELNPGLVGTDHLAMIESDKS